MRRTMTAAAAMAIAAGCLAWAGPARGIDGTPRIALLSEAIGGGSGNGPSGYGDLLSISADGRFAAFESSATDLTSGPSNFSDIYVRDRDPDGNGVFDEPGATTVSLTGDVGGGSGLPQLDGSGRFVLFATSAPEYGSTGGPIVVVRDRDADADGVFDEAGGITTTPTIADPTFQGLFGSMSDDGLQAVVAGSEDGFATTGLWVVDLTTSASTRIDVAPDGTPGDASSTSWYPTISEDGRYVLFESSANNLAPDDDDHIQDMFLHDRDVDADGVFDEAGDTSNTIVSTIPTVFGGGAGFHGRISPNGRRIVYETTMSTGRVLVLVDRDSDGNGTFDEAGGTSVRTDLGEGYDGVDHGGFLTNANLSRDGRYLSFLADNDAQMVADDTNQDCQDFPDPEDPEGDPITSCSPALDLFIRDLDTDAISIVTRAPDGSQADASTLNIAALSADGRHVLFMSRASNLVSGDANDVYDVFALDRRVEGTTGTVPAGGSVTTGDDASPGDPVEATITSPTGGTITIEELPNPTGTPPAGYGFAGTELTITAPPATVTDPLRLEFRADPSAFPAGATLASATVFRDGVALPDCTGPSGEAVPDACITSRMVSGDDWVLTALSSHASKWNLGFATAPHVDAADVQVTEGRKDTTAVVTLTLSSALTAPVTISYKTANESAKSGQDYSPASGRVTFGPGVTTTTIPITIVGDRGREPTERLRLLLKGERTSVIVDPEAIITILDDD